MSLSKPLAGMKDVPLPYEVFLCVIEQFIENARADQGAQSLSIHYNHNSKARLAVCYATEKGEMIYELATDRFNAIRIPLQLNRQTRAMVDRVFRLVPMGGFRETSHGILRVLPDLDYFTPFYFSTSTFPPMSDEYLQEHFFHDNVYLPNAEGYSVLQNIKHLLLPPEAFINDYEQESAIVAGTNTLLSLPNVQSLSIHLGKVNKDLVTSMGTIHAGLQRIDGAIFPDLAMWETMVSNMATLVRPLQQKGIKFRGFLEVLNVDVLEFLFTEDGGIWVEYLRANCNCCKPGVQKK